jgi:hypothetical protein
MINSNPNPIAEGLLREIALRQQQYPHYRERSAGNR